MTTLISACVFGYCHGATLHAQTADPALVVPSEQTTEPAIDSAEPEAEERRKYRFEKKGAIVFLSLIHI